MEAPNREKRDSTHLLRSADSTGSLLPRCAAISCLVPAVPAHWYPLIDATKWTGARSVVSDTAAQNDPQLVQKNLSLRLSVCLSPSLSAVSLSLCPPLTAKVRTEVSATNFLT